MATTFTTGVSNLPDIGVLRYNGVTFSPYFETKFSGVAVKDNANRTIKYMEFTLTVDGFVTLGDGDSTTDDIMNTLFRRLNQQGGELTYTGKGFCNLIVNRAGGTLKDVAWGPVPETLDFKTLGAGRSAKVTWTVKFCIPYQTAVGGRLGPVLQFNEETNVSYDDEGFSKLSIKGTLEIPLTRTTVNTRTLTNTVDDFRSLWLDQVARGIDLTRFRVTSRDFKVSRDKRTMEWEFTAEELPYMGPPPFCTNARGSYDVKPSNAGYGLVTWNCTLRCTYTVRNDQPRRTAWTAFLTMWQHRMNQYLNPANRNILQNTTTTISPLAQIAGQGIATLTGGWPMGLYVSVFQSNGQSPPSPIRPLPFDFSVSEGMYLDSRTITFSASWRIVTTISHILLASGIWTKSIDVKDRNLWAQSMRAVSGSVSWLENRLDPSADVIVDFGGDR